MSWLLLRLVISMQVLNMKIGLNFYMVKVTLSLPSFTLWPLYTWGESPQNPLNMRLDGHQPQSGYLEKEKRFLPLLKIEPQVLSFLSPYTKMST